MNVDTMTYMKLTDHQKDRWIYQKFVLFRESPFSKAVFTKIFLA